MRANAPAGRLLAPSKAVPRPGGFPPGRGLRLNRWVSNYGDWQFSVYLDGLTGKRPALPMSFAELERQAEAAMSAEMWSYVAGGAGDERTQRANVRAFEGWGLVPRMLAAAAERDVSVEWFG